MLTMADEGIDHATLDMILGTAQTVDVARFAGVVL